jgi:hypothetical protein
VAGQGRGRRRQVPALLLGSRRIDAEELVVVAAPVRFGRQWAQQRLESQPGLLAVQRELQGDRPSPVRAVLAATVAGVAAAAVTYKALRA